MSGTIRIISASAGSGKTSRLASLLEERVVSGACRPDAIVATTFTNKAAAELQERARMQLLRAGRSADAQRLAASRIGTVNAVCNRLVSEFAFEMGQSPSLSVLDEDESARALRRALASVIDGSPEIEELTELGTRMDDFDWQDAVRAIIDTARNNFIEPSSFGAMAERSASDLLALLEPAQRTAAALDRALLDAAQAFLRGLDRERDATKSTAGYADALTEIALRMDRGRPIRWREWAKLASSAPAKKSAELAAPVVEAARAYMAHPRLRRDIERAVDLVFAVAARAMAAYAEYKRALGAVDFSDQEVLALGLLRRADIRERIAAGLDLVLVDEFQDTSPLQLALFLELAKVARESVWVGDQKQSIYGFRGTDPALMDAAVAGILAGEEPETLPRGWRSRPALVELSSELFVRSFERDGLPASRVRLEPGRAEPTDLGPSVERWWLAPGRNKEQEIAALASAVAQLLADDSVHVWDRASEQPRGVRPGDVAVLCRTNSSCELLAAALEAIGVRAVIARAGLCGTLEGRVVIAGLRLWVDRRDALAAAELGRLLEHPNDPDGWLESVLSRPGVSAFADRPFVSVLQAARRAEPYAGALAALDAVMTALDLRERCLGWPDADRRLANLDALRARAVAFQRTAEAEGAGATAAGLVAYFHELASASADQRAVVADSDAVVVSTWHRAKGLEWPVCVLYQLDKTYPPSGLGVNVLAERDTVELDDPLANRWIRYWPHPFHSNQSRTPFHERLAEHPVTVALQQRERRQELRLLYVGWTRARDRLVLASRAPTGGSEPLQQGLLAHLRDGAGPLLVDPLPRAEPGPAASPPAATQRAAKPKARKADKPARPEPAGVEAVSAASPTIATRAPAAVGAGTVPPRLVAASWAGRRVDILVREASPVGPIERVVALAEGYDVPAELMNHPPAVVVPSGLEAVGRVLATETIGDRIAVAGEPDMTSIGLAVHGFFAADRPALDEPTRRGILEQLLGRWGVAGALDPEGVLLAGLALRAWVEGRWPLAEWRREWPVLHRLTTGSLLRGVADLVIDAPAGVAIIDHKSFPGSLEEAVGRAAEHAGQLRGYADAVSTATGKPLLGTFIHLPLAGLVVEVAV